MQQPSLAQEVIVGNARILIGDSREALSLFDSESVQCCVTSPPYWGLLGSSAGSGSHPAVFPHELAQRCILLGSRLGDVILDPFAGSGTTGIVAVELRRQAILIELNEAYARESEANLRQAVQECLWT